MDIAWKKRAKDLLAQPPEGRNTDDRFAAAAAAWNDRAPDRRQVEATARNMTSGLDVVERAGGRAYYVLLPVYRTLAETAYARLGVETLQTIDPNFKRRFLAIDWDPEIRWDDGSHVDERSAVIVARQIEAAIKARP